MLRESVGFDAFEIGWPDPEPDVARLRAALGEEAFAEAWEQGRAMTLDEALDYALGEEAASGRPAAVCAFIAPISSHHRV